MPVKNIYQECAIPENLSFDEESLFWRLRLGEGIPNRVWHKPFDRLKSWHEIKHSLDKKLASKRTHSIFQKVYPQSYSFRTWIDKLIKTLKRSFLLED